jgi:PPOX class probable F420-dependent enzyme
VCHLATADVRGAPHVVPICFVLHGETIYSAVDQKPKRTRRLRRLANVLENPRAAVLSDHYDERWEALWWVRADGDARVIDADCEEGRHALALLRSRYPQYVSHPPAGPILAVDVRRWSGWAWDDTAG